MPPSTFRALTICLRFVPSCRLAHSASSGQMRALLAHEYGGIDQLRLSHSVRAPAVASPSHLLVRVRAASLNPVDLALLNGYGSRAFAPLRRLASLRGDGSPELPLVLGRDFSGEVVAVGKAAAGDFRPGQAVFGSVWPFRPGTLCDLLTVRAREVAPKPACWEHSQAASVPYAGLTAFSALTQAGLLRPESLRGLSLLVHGASGGVGSLAVQLAAAWGAFVTGTVRAEAEEFSLKLGANAIAALGPDSDLLSEVMTLSPGHAGYDVVLDCVGLDLVAKAVKSGQLGRYVTLRSDLISQMDALGPLGAASAAFSLLQRNATEIGRHQRLYSWGFFQPCGANLRRIAALGEQNQLTPFIDSIFPLEEAPDAFRKLQAGGVRGKIVISFD